MVLFIMILKMARREGKRDGGKVEGPDIFKYMLELTVQTLVSWMEAHLKSPMFLNT